MSVASLNPATQVPSQQSGIMGVPVGYTALHFACSGSSVCFKNGELVHRLAERRIDLNPRDLKGSTPLQLAVSTGILDAVQQLVRRGADIFATNANGKGIIELAAKCSPSVAEWLRAHTQVTETKGNESSQNRCRIESKSKVLRHSTAIRKTSAATAQEEQNWRPANMDDAAPKMDKGKGKGNRMGKGKQ